MTQLGFHDSALGLFAPDGDEAEGAPLTAGAKLPSYIGDHRKRLRTRFMDGGAQALPDYEMLELVLFRAIPMGLVYNWKLSGALSSWIYFAGSSLFFSLFHIYPLHPFRTPQTIIIGLTLALLYKKEGLLASTCAHIFFNATVFIYFLSK